MFLDKYRKEIRAIIVLAIPVIIAQASQTAVTFVDTMMAGHYSPMDLSGVAIGSSIWLPTILFAQGLLSILTPIIAHLNGAAKREHIANYTRQGLIVATILSIIVMVILYNSDKIIAIRSSSAAINPEMADIAVRFLRAIMWGVPAYLYFQVYRNQCEGLSNTKPAMVIAFVALLTNIPINYIAIYGKLGVPEFGGVGCGIATAIVYWLMFGLIKCYTAYTGSQRDIRQTPIAHFFDFSIMKRISFLGLPLALALFFEVSLFAIISLLIAPLGEIAVAGHQIIFTISSMTFVLPFALSIATSIRVGYSLGQNQPEKAKHIAYISLVIAFVMSLTVAALLVIFDSYLIAMFTQDIYVIALCGQLIILLAVYQCSDYLQIIAGSVLRGYRDTKSIFVVTFISYWLIGLPMGYFLGLTDYIVSTPMGPSGFWVGIIIGLSIAAVLLLGRMVVIQRQPIDKILNRASR